MNIREIGKTSGIENLIKGEKVLLNGINKNLDIPKKLGVVAYVDRNQEEYPGFVVAARSDKHDVIYLDGFTKNTKGEWEQYLFYLIGKYALGFRINPTYKGYDNLLKTRDL